MSDDEVKSALAKPAHHDAWTRIYRGKDHEAYFAYAFDLADQFYRDTKPGPVLDAGCGTGNHIRHLTQREYDVHAIDYSPVTIERACHNRAEISCGRTVQMEVADILKLPFSGNHFTRVLCWGVLMHIPSVEQAISELCRVTASGGRIVIAELNQDALQVKLAKVVRTVLCRKLRGDYRATPAGLETWDGPPENQIVARRADIRWLKDAFNRHGANCIGTYSGELTEFYAEVSRPIFRRAIHVLNRFWYRWIRWPGLAASNILIFEKQPCC